MNLLTILLQAAEPGKLGIGSPIIMMLLIFVILYFFMIRPQSKRQKEIKKQREAMKPGDKVITAGGIYGKVRAIKDATVTVEIAENVRIVVAKTSVYATADDVPQEINN